MQRERRVPSEADFDYDWIKGKIAQWDVEDGDELEEIEQAIADDEWEEVALG